MAWPHVDDLTSPHPLLAAKLGSRTLFRPGWVNHAPLQSFGGASGLRHR
jgi:hypothetical protein